MSCIATHCCCPECHSREGYRLSDGRRKCCRCGKKYSRRHLKSRLPSKVLKKIAQYFWLITPVSTVAADLHVDRKTVRRHYELMQHGISAVENECCGSVNHGEVREMFCLYINDETTWCERTSSRTCQRIRVADKEYYWNYSVLISLPFTALVIRCLVYQVVGRSCDGAERWQPELVQLEKIVQRVSYRKKELNTQARQRLMAEAVFRFNQRCNPGVTADLYRFLRF